MKEYRTIHEVSGPLMVVEQVEGVTYDELGEIELSDGSVRRCQVLEVNGDTAVVQLFDSSAGINLRDSKVRFLGHPLQLAVSGDMLGRVFNGMGQPIDGGPAILPEAYRDINGLPMNPAARDYPNEFIQTGVSTIDGLNTLVRGQKLPIFSGSGLPHAQLAAQIARQAKVLGDEGNFAVVFAAIGITFEESEYFVNEFKRTGAIDRTVLFTNLANDPAVERIATPRMALTAAEYLAFDKDMHVLVILTDITNYAEALREVSAAKEGGPRPPGLSGLPVHQPGHHLRAGRPAAGEEGLHHHDPHPHHARGRQDPPHPRPDRLYHRGADHPLPGTVPQGHPAPGGRAAQPLPSEGQGHRRRPHPGGPRRHHEPALRRLRRGKEAKELMTILGEAALSPTDLLYAKFADEFERRYVNQGFEENRSIEETLDLGWELLRSCPGASSSASSRI